MEEQKKRYLATLTPKEMIVYELAVEQLQIRLEDMLDFQKWSQDNITNGNQRNADTDATDG